MLSFNCCPKPSQHHEMYVALTMQLTVLPPQSQRVREMCASNTAQVPKGKGGIDYEWQ